MAAAVGRQRRGRTEAGGDAGPVDRDSFAARKATDTPVLMQSRRTTAARRAPPGTAAPSSPLPRGAPVRESRSSRPLLT